MARRLPQLVVASPLRCLGWAVEVTDLLLVTLVTALGALRVGGCLCLSLQDAVGSLEAESFLTLLALLFERVDAVPARWHLAGARAVFIVGLHFRGIGGAVLQALAEAVRRTLAGKQPRVLPEDWVQRMLVGPPMLARLAQLLFSQGATPPAVRQGRVEARLHVQTYARSLGLRPIPQQCHLLWSCWPDFLAKAPRGGPPPPAAGRAPGARGRAELQRLRERAWLLARKRRRSVAGADLLEPPSKRARRLPGTPAAGEAQALPPVEPFSPRWFALDDAGNLAHRGLLRSLQSKEAALQTAQSQWWRPSKVTAPWRFLHSAFAPTHKLLALVEARSVTGVAPGLGHALGALQDAADGVPPLLVATWVHLLQNCLPERLGEGRDRLIYERVLHLHDAGLEFADEALSSTASWLSEQMHVRAKSRSVTGWMGAAGVARDGGEGFDAVLIDFASSAFADYPSSEVAGTEMDETARKDLVGLLRVGLSSAAPGADLFLRLPSLYTRFLASLCVLLAVAFDRVAPALPRLAPARGERWLLCSGFCSVDQRGPVVAELLGAFHARLLALKAGSSVAQVLPLSCTCSPAFGLQQLLRDVNEEAIDAEFQRLSVLQPEPGPLDGDAGKTVALRHLAAWGIKPILYPGPAHRAIVGVYFGTFDPLHENHFRVALCALRRCGTQRVVLVPNETGNPYKPLCTTLQHRIRCIEARLAEAVVTGELRQGEVTVRVARGATNWPQREELARVIEREEFAETTTSAEVVLLLGEDSFLKSLESAAGKHKNSGIFQLRTRPRRIIVFPRGGGREGILVKVPDRLRPWVQVAPHKDLVQGLSSSRLRELLESRGSVPPADSVHPAVWRLAIQGRREEEPASVAAQPLPPTEATEDTRLHYDVKLPQTMEQRQASPTVRLRNFNSFAKAVLLEQILAELRREAGSGDAPLSVLDLGCGQGGDIKKMANCGVTEYCGVDFSAASLQALLARVEALRGDAGRARHGLLGEAGLPLREVSVLCADCWRSRLSPALDASARHGTARLEGLNQDAAEMMLRNASERLCAGGFFAGTLPDAARIIRAQQEAWETSGELRSGNELYTIEFESAQWAKVRERFHEWTATSAGPGRDVFGVTYRFSLVDAVDGCCEPLVHFSTFECMARRYGLVLHMGPTPLADLVTSALAADDAKAELGRLRRIYHYHGGMRCDEHSPEWSALGLYSAFVFRKEPSGSEAPMTCEQLSGSLRRLHSQQGPGFLVPSAPCGDAREPPGTTARVRAGRSGGEHGTLAG
uniref:mRNA (guanine-N(7))-methyltransferase n=1 Tax=Alexandrium monilatum TaxID=311494 RepID=A0A7S4PYI9_9DINO